MKCSNPRCEPCRARDEPQPEPSAEADLFQRLLTFMSERDEWGTVGDVLRSAEDAGLGIVPAADVPSVEERAVLEALADVEIHTCEFNAEMSSEAETRVCRAELARRAAKEGNRG